MYLFRENLFNLFVKYDIIVAFYMVGKIIIMLNFLYGHSNGMY